MRWAVAVSSASLGIAVGFCLAAGAQPYCAMYDTGNRNCGIPTLESCRQSLSGLGGYCTPDETSQMRPDVFQTPRIFQPQPSTSPFDPNNPSSPGWVPPPPDQ
jgi:hypothetical protein